MWSLGYTLMLLLRRRIRTPAPTPISVKDKARSNFPEF